MTKLIKFTKTQLIAMLKNVNIECDEKMTKTQLIELYDNYIIECQKIQSKNSIAIIENNLQIIENDENENFENNENENIDNMTIQFANFLQFEIDCNYSIENDMFCIFANKKHIFIKIDNEQNFAFVFTILNKKMSNNMNENKLHARNILTLKSLKATKSFTICHMK